MASGLIEEVLRLNADQATGQLRAVATEAVAADKALEQVGTTTQTAGARAAGASGALGQLAFQLNDVATMAALGANPLQILASQGGQIAQVFAQAGGPVALFNAALEKLVPLVTRFGPALGIVGAALAVTKVTLDAVHASTEQARLEFERVSEAVERMRDAVDKANEATAGADDFLSEATGAVDQFEAAKRREIERYKEGREAVEAELRMRVTEAQALTGNTARYTEQDKALASAKKALAEYVAETHDYVENLTLAADGLRRNKELDDQAAASKQALAEASRRAAEAAREEAKAWREFQREIAREREVEAKARADATAAADRFFGPDTAAMMGIQAIRDYAEAVAGAAGDTTKLTLATTDLTLALSRGLITAEQYDAAIASAGSTTSTDGTVSASTVSSALSNPLSAIAGADPTGIAGAVIAGLQAAARLPETLSSFSDLFASAIGNLGSTGASGVASFAARFVSELLPKLVTAGGEFAVGLVEEIPRLLEAAAAAIGPLVVALVENFVLLAPRIAVALAETLLNPATWIDAGRALGEGFLDAIGALLDAIRDLVEKILPGRQFGGNPSQRGLFTGGGFFDDAERTLFRPGQNAEGGPSKAAAFFSSVGASISDAFAGVFDDGASYVNRSGLAVVHAGEEIVQRGGRRSAAAAMEAGSTSGGTARLTGRGGRLHLELDPAELYRALSHSGSALGLAGAFPLGG